jgi:YHS domain-containing protein
MIQDPVCGMMVDEERAEEQGLSLLHNGQVYYFCSTACALQFEQDPQPFVLQPISTEQ